MNTMLSKAILFIAGGIIGSAVTYTVTKKKYENIANDEINSMREYYDTKYNNDDSTSTVVSEEDKKKYDDILSDAEYTLISNEEETKEVDEDMHEPEVIPPEESWEKDYPTISLIYYEGDNVLANTDNDIIKNVEELVGTDFAEHFGEYEPDTVLIRNDKHKAYYEILRDYGSYIDYMGGGE